MEIKSVSFTGHKKKHTPIQNALGIALKGGVGAVAGYALGRYMLPVSNELAEKVLTNNLVDTFVEKQPKPRPRKSKVKKEDVKKETKVTTPKAKTNIYVKLKEMALKGISTIEEKATKTAQELKLDKLYKDFQNYATEFCTKNGGKEKCVQDVRISLRSAVGRKIGLFTGVLFTTAAILDQAFKSSHKNHS